MRKSRFNEAQIAEVLKECESGVRINYLIRTHGGVAIFARLLLDTAQPHRCHQQRSTRLFRSIATKLRLADEFKLKCYSHFPMH